MGSLQSVLCGSWKLACCILPHDWTLPFHGKGIFIWSDQKKYEGDWKNGVQEGIGKTNHPDGREYLGEYNNGEENGFGEWSDLDGQTYRGEFKDGNFDGKGICNVPDGGSYQGEFVEGRIEGEGEYKFPDGNIAKGIWKDNKPWDVVGTLKNGEVNGYYENGEFISVENKTKLI